MKIRWSEHGSIWSSPKQILKDVKIFQLYKAQHEDDYKSPMSLYGVFYHVMLIGLYEFEWQAEEELRKIRDAAHDDEEEVWIDPYLLNTAAKNEE